MSQKKLLHLIFDVLDEERTGLLSPSTFMLLLRVLGFRVTLPNVLRDIQTAIKKRRRIIDTQNSTLNLDKTNASFRFECTNDIDSDPLVDFDLAQEIIENQSNHPSHLDCMDLFRLFDPTDTGYVTVNSLEQVISELLEQENIQPGDDDMGRRLLPVRIGDEDLSAMIHEFDRDGDGRINYEDFNSMMERY